jgi:hypothetical protein
MKNVLFVTLAALMVAGCMSYTGTYKVGLQEVERPENAKERYGDSKIVNFDEDGSTKYSYEDSLIQIVWLPATKQFGFMMLNKTEHSIKIIWDEAVYIDENGASGKVMHAGVKYIDRNSSQPATIVPKKARIDDMVLPTDKVYYVSGQYGGWSTRPLFPNLATNQENLNTLTAMYIGKTVKILLPLQIEETVNEYTFSFKVEDFISKK